MKLKDKQKISQIYQATLRVIGKTGIAGISMAAIAREAGLATGTLYTYFESKEELIISLYRESKKRSTEQFFKGYEPGGPFKVGIKHIWFNYLEDKLAHYEEGIFQEQYYNSPYVEAQTMESSLLLMAPLFELLERGKRELLVKDIDNNLLVIHLLGPVRELVTLIRMDQRYRERIRLEQAFGLCWDGIKA
jgi:AcrR family transcriptional regulator